MKIVKLNHIYLLLLCLVQIGCQVENPMASEQYDKKIYIVGAANRVSSFDLPYGDNQEAFVSISTSGTKKIDKDAEVELKHDNSIIEWYNKKYMLDAPVKYRQLDAQYLQIPSWKVTLKSGQIYTRFPFTIQSSSLHCDSLYAISYVIESTTQYEAMSSGSELIFTLKLVNDYSGNYQMSATKIVLEQDAQTGEWVEGNVKPINTSRILTACAANEVRFFHEQTRETLDEYKNSWEPGKDYFNAIKNLCIKFVKTNVPNKFTVEPWESMKILAGEAEFKDKTFTFWYDYVEDSKHYRMRGTLTDQ